MGIDAFQIGMEYYTNQSYNSCDRQPSMPFRNGTSPIRQETPMPPQPTSTPLFVRLTSRAMAPGQPAWPQAADRRDDARLALRQALVDVLDYDCAQETTIGRSAADAVATALLSAFGHGRWSLRSAPGTAEILGKF
jgi:hypothetical protein